MCSYAPGVTAGIFLSSILIKEMRYLVYIRYLWKQLVSAIKANVSRYGLRHGNISANIENHEYFRDNISYVWPRLSKALV
jgi:hypothetical protein